jgi:DNA (cytosine-5)-methyltransferase 1
LFAGCGGLSLGLYNSNKWKGLFAIEKSPMAFETLKFNLVDQKPHFDWVDWLPVRSYDINHIVSKYRTQLELLNGQVDLVAGGPPCQGFSTAGKRVEGDSRNKLINSYIKFIDLVRPRTIFFENVKGFTLEFKKNKTRGIAYSEKVVKKLEDLGYTVKGQLVDFSEYGVPQKRVRFILVGFRNDILSEDLSKKFFRKLSKDASKFLINKDLVINPTLEDAISDLLKSNGVVSSPDSRGFDAGLYGKSKSKGLLKNKLSICSIG